MDVEVQGSGPPLCRVLSADDEAVAAGDAKAQGHARSEGKGHTL